MAHVAAPPDDALDDDRVDTARVGAIADDDDGARACAMGMKGAQHAHEASSPSTPRRGPDARDADAARVGRLLARTDATRAVAREVLKNDIVLAMECVARRTRAVCDMLDRRPLARASS